jgi:hypothetical protein
MAKHYKQQIPKGAMCEQGYSSRNTASADGLGAGAWVIGWVELSKGEKSSFLQIALP